MSTDTIRAMAVDEQAANPEDAASMILHIFQEDVREGECVGMVKIRGYRTLVGACIYPPHGAIPRPLYSVIEGGPWSADQSHVERLITQVLSGEARSFVLERSFGTRKLAVCWSAV